MKIPPCLVLTRVSVSNTLTRTHHLFLVLFFIYFWLLRFFILTFFFFYIHLGFSHAACTPRQLNTQTVFQLKHPVWANSVVAFVPVKYITQRHIPSKITLQPSGLFFSSRQHVSSAAVLQKETRLSPIDYLIRKAATLSAINWTA